jgi:hypothetical protein
MRKTERAFGKLFKTKISVAGKSLSMLSFFILLKTASFAQDVIEISGLVTDQDRKEPLQGVAVRDQRNGGRNCNRERRPFYPYAPNKNFRSPCLYFRRLYSAGSTGHHAGLQIAGGPGYSNRFGKRGGGNGIPCS